MVPGVHTAEESSNPFIFSPLNYTVLPIPTRTIIIWHLRENSMSQSATTIIHFVILAGGLLEFKFNSLADWEIYLQYIMWTEIFELIPHFVFRELRNL